METKSSFFMPSKIKIVIFAGAFVLAGCQGLRTRDQAKRSTPIVLKPGSAAPSPVPPPPPAAQPNAPLIVDNPPMEPMAPAGEEGPHVEISPNVPLAKIPKVGLILGPGGARTFAHIGVLQEFQREKIPVVAVAGIEWGAPIAALYSGKGLANEAEWQMSKIKPDDVVKKSLIGGGKPGDAKALTDFLKLAFGPSRAEDGKLPFACPALNFAKNQVYLMTKGSFEQMLPYCIAYPPLFRPYQGNVAATREVKLIADNLRSRGATVIVLVNVLPLPNLTRPIAGDEGSSEAVLWNELSSLYSKPFPGVDQVLNVSAGSATLTSFDVHRETLQKGSESGAPLVRQLARRLGL